jgi:hypothetical protein
MEERAEFLVDYASEHGPVSAAFTAKPKFMAYPESTRTIRATPKYSAKS